MYATNCTCQEKLLRIIANGSVTICIYRKTYYLCIMDMVLIEGQVEGLRTRVDGTIAVTIGTQELAPDTAAAIFTLNRRHVHALLKSDPVTDIEQRAVAELSKEWESAKSPASRLRGVLYRVWEQTETGHSTFDTFYLAEMERIIKHYKEKLV